MDSALTEHELTCPSTRLQVTCGVPILVNLHPNSEHRTSSNCAALIRPLNLSGIVCTGLSAVPGSCCALGDLPEVEGAPRDLMSLPDTGADAWIADSGWDPGVQGAGVRKVTGGEESSLLPSRPDCLFMSGRQQSVPICALSCVYWEAVWCLNRRRGWVRHLTASTVAQLPGLGALLCSFACLPHSMRSFLTLPVPDGLATIHAKIQPNICGVAVSSSTYILVPRCHYCECLKICCAA